MALSDDAVRDGGKLHILLALIGTTTPTQTLVNTFNPDTGSLGDEVQTVTITGTPTGGTFTLTYSGQTTAAIAYNATAATVQAALEALSNLAPGDVTCTGGPLPGAAVTVAFVGQGNVAQMTATSSLTGGTTPAVTVTTTTAPSAWDNFGHTDLEEDVETEEEGGDSEVRGSRQNPALREKIEPVTQFLTINSIQVDAATIAYYFGDATITAGVAETNGTFTATERAALLIFIDGDVKSAVHYPKASIRRGGPPAMAGEGFRRLPIRITPLKLTGQPLQRWIDPAIAVPAA